MESEARHYVTFLNFAKKYGGKIDVNDRWEEFLKFEANLMTEYGKSETIHG
jgi:tRNA-(ms[2]io[6]A)-hydroxylase